METTLKFFIVSLCVTKLIVLLVLRRHGQGFLASVCNHFWLGQTTGPSKLPEASNLQAPATEPLETTAYFCQVTLYHKVNRFALGNDNRSRSAVLSNGQKLSAPPLPTRS